MFRCSTFLLIALALCSIAPAFQLTEPFKPGKLPPAEVAALRQGLTLRFYQDAKPLDARRVRLAALHVPAGDAPSPFVAPGPFIAKFSGYIKNPLKASYTFRLIGAGSITFKINDKVALVHSSTALTPSKDVEIELAKNYNKIEIDYVSPPKGDATLRLYWSGEKFGFEPVLPEVLSSRGDDKDLVEQTTLREGRILFANRHCGHCHGGTKSEMPELHVAWNDAMPRLDDVGYRFQPDWLASWILNPRSVRPDATMPRVLTGPDAEKHAADIAAYLVSLKKYAEPKPLGKNLKASDGAALFARLGCVSCHRLDDPQMKDDLDRLSLHHVRAKFAPNALAHFLKEPHYRYPWTRMPDFMLSDDEAGQLEVFLREKAKVKFDVKPKGDAKHGEELFASAHCNGCHSTARVGVNDMNGVIGKLFVPRLNLDKGCLAQNDHGKAPDFAITKTERAALMAFLKTDEKSLTRESPSEFSQRQMQSLQCASCHRRDGASTRWHAVLEEEGKDPEKLPSLTWIGEKLQPEWTKKLLAGAHDHRARPWIKARMPAFPARAALLAVGLSHEHGFGVGDDPRPLHDAKLALIGEKLVPQQGGFNCINCHAIGKTPPTAPFEAPGINLLDAAQRLRYAYYQRWMLSPDRVDVTMRMPVFAIDGKTTQLREVLDGDAARQFDALWHHIQTLPISKRQ